MKRKWCILVLLCIVCEAVPLRAEWQRTVTNYTRQQYGAANQNWGLQQCDNGWMYVANERGLLEFDGSGWTLYHARNARLRTVRVGLDGRVYVGGIGQFGYFEPDGLGGLAYVSLSDSLPYGSVPGVVRSIWEVGGTVCFQSDRTLFYWDGRRLTQLAYGGEIYASAALYNEFYVATSEGVLRVEDGDFCPVPGSGGLGRLAELLPYNGKVLIVTRFNGLYVYDGREVRPYATPADAFMRANHVFCAAIDGSLLALGSVQGGVCLLDLEKGTSEVVSIHNGLQNKTVLGVCFDARRDLWLGLDNGIDCVRLSQPTFSLYGARPLIGSGYASAVYGGRLYLGTNQGLFCTRYPDRHDAAVPMELVEGTGGQVWSLLEHDGRLFCASDNGLFVVGPDRRASRLGNIRGVRRIVSLHGRDDVLLVGAYGKDNGLHLLRRTAGGWQLDGRLDGFWVSPKNVWMEPSDSVLWLTNKEVGVCRLELSPDLRSVSAWRAYNHRALPTGSDCFLAGVDGQMVVASHYGLWRYDSRADSLVEDTRLEELLDGKTAYTYLAADEAHNLWYVAGGVLKLVRYDAVKGLYSHDLRDAYLRGSLIDDSEHVAFYGRQALVGTEDGFSLVDPSLEVPPAVRPSLQIRRVYLTGLQDSLVYGRSYRWKDTLLRLPYRCNSLRIEYNAGNCAPGAEPLFAYRLDKDGDDGQWSDYGGHTSKEFAGLREGTYVFHVRLRPVEGQAQVHASLGFVVLPPWYRTWWSYLLYGLAGCLVLGSVYYRVVVVSRRRMLQRQAEEMRRQEQAFRRESEQKDGTIDSLKAEQLQAELRHKSEELARTTLNIVRKNEMLQEIRKEVQGIYRSVSEENLVALRRRSLRLLGQIDTNLEHDKDLEQFQASFDSVHRNFFRHLEQAYPALSIKDRMLCAYLKMDLQSKEIAPLLNITVRGVELARYRLRKKLGLTEGENLAEFLRKFAQ